MSARRLRRGLRQPVLPSRRLELQRRRGAAGGRPAEAGGARRRPLGRRRLAVLPGPAPRSRLGRRGSRIRGGCSLAGAASALRLPARCAAPVAMLSTVGRDKCTVPCAYRTGERASSPAPQARTNARTGQDGCGLACQRSPHQKSRRVSSNRRGLRWRGRPRGGRRIARRPRGSAGLRM